MVLNFVLSIAASLIASVITGFLGNKAISRYNNIILKIYILFLSIIIFICSVMTNIILNKDIGERIARISEVNLLRFYSNCINSFIFIIAIVAIFSFIIVVIEAFDRGARRDHKEDMDRYKQLK